MNKEVGYIMQGFLLLVVVVAAAGAGQFLFSMKPHDTPTTNIPATSNVAIKPDVNSQGAVLFRENCARCHALFKDLTGPGLAGVTKRVTDRKLLYSWVRNSQAALKSGDPYFNGLFKAYSNVAMSSFPDLTDADIEAILLYIESNTGGDLPSAHAQ